MDHKDKRSEREAGGAQALERALLLLRLVAAHTAAGIRLTDLVAASGLAKPTTHRLIRTLERNGLVEQSEESKRYFLGPETFVMGALSSERFGIQRAAIPSLTRLAAESQDSAFLSVRRGQHSVCLRREEGAYPIRTQVLQAGHRHPLGVGAGSLALLAALGDDELEEVLCSNADELARHYPTYSIGFLRDAVAQTREQGFAFNPGQLLPGSWGIGVAVVDATGICHGAISIAAIESRLGEARRLQLVPVLRQEAVRLAGHLQAPTRRHETTPTPLKRKEA